MSELLMILRTMRRHKLRVLLNFFSIFLTAFLLHIYFAAFWGFEDVLGGGTLQGTGLVKPLRGAMWESTVPCSHVDVVREVPGVAAATCQMSGVVLLDEFEVWFAGVDPEAWRVIVGSDFDVPPEVWKEFASDPNAALISRGERLRRGFRIGQRASVPLYNPVQRKDFPDLVKPDDPRLDIRIVGEVTKGPFAQTLLILHLDPLMKALNWPRGLGIMLRFEPGADPNAVAQEIESRLASRESVEVMLLNLMTIGLSNFVRQLGSLVLFVIGLVGVMITAILIHGSALTAIEMMPQIGILRAHGGSRFSALAVIAGEGFIVAAAGASLASGILHILTKTSLVIDMSQIAGAAGPILAVRWQAIAIVLAGAAAIAVFGAVVPAMVMARRSMSALLRGGRGGVL